MVVLSRGALSALTTGSPYCSFSLKSEKSFLGRYPFSSSYTWLMRITLSTTAGLPFFFVISLAEALGLATNIQQGFIEAVTMRCIPFVSCVCAALISVSMFYVCLFVCLCAPTAFISFLSSLSYIALVYSLPAQQFSGLLSRYFLQRLRHNRLLLSSFVSPLILADPSVRLHGNLPRARSRKQPRLLTRILLGGNLGRLTVSYAKVFSFSVGNEAPRDLFSRSSVPVYALAKRCRGRVRC